MRLWTHFPLSEGKVVFGRFHLSLDQSLLRCTSTSPGYPTRGALVQLPSCDVALSNRLRRQPITSPETCSLRFSTRRTGHHSLMPLSSHGLTGPLMAVRLPGIGPVAMNHLDRKGFVRDKRTWRSSPTLLTRVFFEGAALDKRPLRLSYCHTPYRRSTISFTALSYAASHVHTASSDIPSGAARGSPLDPARRPSMWARMRQSESWQSTYFTRL